MKNFRKIIRSHIAPQVQMGDIQLRQAFPLSNLEQISPFILLHHFDVTKGPGEHDFNVPPHPHRGFSPVTFIFEGAIRHTDSLGNDEVIGANEVQWINAGRGIIHGEKVGSELVENGGRMQGIQLWINTLAAHKMDPPFYLPITKKELILIEKEGVEFRLVSGKYDGKKGPAPSEALTGMLKMKEGSDFTLDLSPEHNSAIYILEGSVRVNKLQLALQHELVQFEKADGDVLLEATKDSKILIMAGAPINEPLVTHGPFVMNTQTEILEAMRDYRENKMGFLY
jgi:redox-sensitive bicupin YhaK (pirin superfamily)